MHARQKIGGGRGTLTFLSALHWCLKATSNYIPRSRVTESCAPFRTLVIMTRIYSRIDLNNLTKFEKSLAGFGSLRVFVIVEF